MKKAVIGIIFSPNRQKVLCIKRRDVPVWVLPGGGVDQDELPEDAVIREVLEETGLKTKIHRKVGVYTPINRLSHHTEVFECTPLGGELTIGAETSDVQYWPIDSLHKNFFVIHRDWLADAVDNRDSVLHKPISGVTYWNLFKHIVSHPLWVARLILSRCGYPINS